jgi:glycerol-3-phosphate dehydrogenase
VDFNDPFYFYGSEAVELKNRVAHDPEGWISKKLQIHKQQMLWAVSNEMARTVEDVLSRRTRALLLDAEESIRMAPAVATIMAEYFKYDEKWVREQVEAYTKLAKNYLISL